MPNSFFLFCFFFLYHWWLRLYFFFQETIRKSEARVVSCGSKQYVQQFIEHESQGVVFQKHIGGKWPVFRAGGFWRCRPEIWGYLGFFLWGHENLIPPVGRQPSPLRTPPSARWVWSRCSGDILWDSAFQWVSLALCGAYNCIFFKHHCRSGATLLKAFLPGYPLKARLHNMDGPSNCHTEWCKSDRGSEILYTTCIQNLKRRKKWYK